MKTLSLSLLFVMAFLCHNAQAQTYIRDEVGRLVEVRYSNCFSIFYDTDAGGGRILRIVTCNSILPIEFISFDAQKYKETQALLTWIVQDEGGETVSYAVQHSTDGKTFTSLDTVPRNVYQRGNYRFVHTEPFLQGVNYYRIQHLDKDSKAILTPVRQVFYNEYPNSLEVSLYPNPTDGNTLHIAFTQPVAQYKPRFSLVDMTGKTLSVEATKQSNNLYTVDVSRVASGTYTLSIQSNKRTFPSKKVVVRK